MFIYVHTASDVTDIILLIIHIKFIKYKRRFHGHS